MNRVDLSDESGALAPLTRATSNGLYAVDHQSPRRRPSVSRVETTVFRRANRWIPQNRPMDSAEQTDGFRIQLEVKKPLFRPEHAPMAAAKKA